ncbi:Ribosomal lysine N-methyltransferase 4 [Collariella sp. IMI 366227]|nr:Ribosomal lysine N-methyltransferase 4 [Collariella sp. IMI 366227]
MMDVDGDENSRFTEGTAKFITWFESLPGTTFHKDIAIEDLRDTNAGRGIIAKADIEADAVLFTIPRNAIICGATTSLKDRIPAIFDLDKYDDSDEDGSSSQDSWTLLILVMMYEYLQGDASMWKPYLDVLPVAFDTPMFWSPAELSELQASAVLGKIGKEEADEMIRSKILSVINTYQHIFFLRGQALNESQLLELAHRMGSAIMAYAFDLDKDDGDEADEEDEWIEDKEGRTMLGMVPMADMLNADAEFNAHINHGEGALTATALRPIKAGEEILNYYGPLPNGELLRRYGYVTRKHSRYDVVELPWELVEQQLKERVGIHMSSADWDKAKQLADAELDEEFEEAFVLERSSEDPDSSGQLHSDATFEGLPEELGEQVKVFLKAVKKTGNIEAQALSDKDTRKEVYLQAVLGALEARERQYATSLEQDRQILFDCYRMTRKNKAVWVRRGEKEVLKDAQAWVRRELGELQTRTAGSRGEDAPAAKKRRL